MIPSSEYKRKRLQKRRIGIVSIYALCCPVSNELKYVGKTGLTLKRRLCFHINNCHKKETIKNSWIRNLLIKNTPPKIVLLEKTTSELASGKEREWIGKIGIENLCNGNVGGGGGNCNGIRRNNSYLARFKHFLSTSNYSNSSQINYHFAVRKFIDYFNSCGSSPKEINSFQINSYINTYTNLRYRNFQIIAIKVFYKNIMQQPHKLKNINYEYF